VTHPEVPILRALYWTVRDVGLILPIADNHGVSSDGLPRTSWVLGLPDGPPEKDSLARIVDAAGGRDEAENFYYEACADPDYVREEREQRRYRGQYLRRLRRLASHGRDGNTGAR